MGTLIEVLLENKYALCSALVSTLIALVPLVLAVPLPLSPASSQLSRVELLLQENQVFSLLGCIIEHNVTGESYELVPHICWYVQSFQVFEPNAPSLLIEDFVLVSIQMTLPKVGHSLIEWGLSMVHNSHHC
jgi:hypothetical protein